MYLLGNILGYLIILGAVYWIGKKIYQKVRKPTKKES